MNDDGLVPGSRVSREDWHRVYFQVRQARKMVIRGEYADFATALAALRS